MVALFRLLSRKASYSYSKHHLFPLKPKDTRMRNSRELQRSYYWKYQQWDNLNMSFFSQQPPVGWASSFTRFLDHTNDAPQSVGLPWTSDKLVAETSTWQHTTLTTDIHAAGGIRTHNLSRRAAADRRLRPRGHCDRRLIMHCRW